MQNNPPPPAPYLGPTLAEAAKILRTNGKLPITLGAGSPSAEIEKRDGQYVLYALELDLAAQARGEQEFAKKGLGLQPEMTWRYLRKGKVIATSSDRESFIESLKQNWRREWGTKK